MKITNKFTSVLLSATTAVVLSGAMMFVPVANAQSMSDLQSQINALLSQISALQSQLASQSGNTGTNVQCNFTRSLTVGSTGDDVLCLQQYLNDGGNSPVALSGVGSKGNETKYFGSLTTTAVAKWQASNGVAPAVGYFGPISRAKFAAVAGGPNTTPNPNPTPSPVPMGSGLTVSLDANQPASGLFGKSFASRPFTVLDFAASYDGDVVVKSLTVQRTGQGADAAFSGVVALDENGIRLGDSKTFSSDHTLKLTNSFTVKAGQVRRITLAGDSPASQTNQAGQLVSLSLIGVDAGSAAVNASFPLKGNFMTVNDTLTVGSLTVTRGPLDPGASLTQQVGTTGYIFSSLKLTAGSTEDLALKSFSWNQSGSAAATDLANLKIYVDGTAYDAMVSADGKYFTAVFNPAITIQKGLSKEVYIKGDVLSGTNRTVTFDLYRYADIQATGLTYGYTILPDATDSGNSSTNHDGTLQATQPNYDGFQVTVGTGTLTIEKATTVVSQNIAINLSNQVLGGFLADVKGEDITVAAMNFDLSTVHGSSSSHADTDGVTNISLYDENGSVIAGPVDGVAGGVNALRFTDTVTLKTGRHVYTIKGKLDSTTFANGDTVAASTTPSSDWTTVKGTVTSQTITPAGGTITMNTMTVKSAALNVSVSSDTGSAASNVNLVAGTNAYPFTKYVLDATGSGEDVRVTSMQLLAYFSAANTGDDMTNCVLKDNGVALNSGSNATPTNSTASGDAMSFAFDQSLIIPKGTIKTLTVYCNLTSAALANQTYGWGIDTLSTTNVVATGMVSGSTVTPTGSADTGRTIVAQTSGALSVTEDPTTALKWIQAGTTDNTMVSLRFNATYEDIRLDTIGLQLATSSSAADAMASNTPNDLSKVTLWVGSTKVGEAYFNANDYATATLTGVIVPKDSQLVVTVKADTGSIGTGLSARPGHLVLVNYDAANSTNCHGGVDTSCQRGAIGVGLSSGTSVGSAGSDTSANGARLAKAVPTVTKLSVPSNTFTQTSSGKSLYRFSVSAPAGTNGVSLYKFTFNIATTSTNVVELADGGTPPTFVNDFGVTNIRVICYSDAYVTPACGNTNGLLNQFGLAIADGTNVDFDDTVISTDPDVDVSVLFNPTATSGATPESIRIPAGSTYYFDLLGDIANATTTASISTKMFGDAQFAALNNDAGGNGGNGDDADNWTTGRYVFATTAANVDAWDDDDFIWSGNSTNTSQSINDYDWFNGYLVPGLNNTDTGVAESLSKSS